LVTEDVSNHTQGDGRNDYSLQQGPFTIKVKNIANVRIMMIIIDHPVIMDDSFYMVNVLRIAGFFDMIVKDDCLVSRR